MARGGGRREEGGTDGERWEIWVRVNLGRSVDVASKPNENSVLRARAIGGEGKVYTLARFRGREKKRTLG